MHTVFIFACIAGSKKEGVGVGIIYQRERSRSWLLFTLDSLKPIKLSVGEVQLEDTGKKQWQMTAPRRYLGRVFSRGGNYICKFCRRDLKSRRTFAISQKRPKRAGDWNDQCSWELRAAEVRGRPELNHPHWKSDLGLISLVHSSIGVHFSWRLCVVGFVRTPKTHTFGLTIRHQQKKEGKISANEKQHRKRNIGKKGAFLCQ